MQYSSYFCYANLGFPNLKAGYITSCSSAYWLKVMGRLACLIQT